MKKFALVSCLLLAGCTDSDWDRTLNYAHLGGAPSEEVDAPVTTAVPQPVTAPRAATQAAAAAPAPVAPAAPENADFCRAVATKDATENGFDPATQQRVLAQSYAQCVAIYTR
jgi:pyruvate/2-oxoglutarate dehydrogenase complex dihydrolipoamide acyltransferase (E2) component